MLLIFRPIARDGFVAKLREFDANFFSSDAICTIANNRPVTPRRSDLLRSSFDIATQCEGLLQRFGNLAEPVEDCSAIW